jgi:hypothetical protein
MKAPGKIIGDTVRVSFVTKMEIFIQDGGSLVKNKVQALIHLNPQE